MSESSSSPIQGHEGDADPHREAASIVMGEVLETTNKGPDPDVESENQIEAHLDSIFDTGESV